MTTLSISQTLAGVATFATMTFLVGCGGGSSPKNNATKRTTRLAFTSPAPTSSEDAKIGFALTASTNAPVPLAEVTAQLDGVALTSVETDAQGTGAVEVAAEQLSPGKHSLTISFAGNDGHQPAEAALALTIGTTDGGGGDGGGGNGGNEETKKVATRIEGQPSYALPATGGELAVTLRDASGAAVPEADLTLAGLPGDPVEATTGADGVARFAIDEATPGSHPLAITYAGDDTHEGARFSTTLSVNAVLQPAQLELGAEGDTMIGGTASVTVAATDDAGNPLAGVPVQVKIRCAGGEQFEGPVTTDAQGNARLPFGISESRGAGTYRATAHFAGNDRALAADGETEFEVDKASSALTFAAAGPTIPLGGSMTVTAHLSMEGSGQPLAGRTVHFLTDAGVEIASAATDGNGNASTAIYAPTWGTYNLTASFAGDGAYESSASDTASFKTVKCESNIRVLDAEGKQGSAAPLRCFITRATDGAPIENALIEFSLGSEYIRSDRSNPSGYSALSLPLGNRGVGTRTIRAVFDGDSRHGAQEGRGTLTIKSR